MKISWLKHSKTYTIIMQYADTFRKQVFWDLGVVFWVSIF